MNSMCLIWSLFGVLAIVNGQFQNVNFHLLTNKKCKTPNNNQERCIPLNKCKNLGNAFKNTTDRFLSFSRCGFGYSNNPFVCCESRFKWWHKIPLKPRPRPSSTPIPRPSSTPTPRPSSTPKPMPISIPIPITIPIPSTTPLPMQTSSAQNESENTSGFRHRNLHLLPPVGECGYQVAVDRIYGGKETGLDEFPWMALLEYENNGQSVGHWCAGVIINERYVLTAAHCIRSSLIERYGHISRVRLGEYNRNTTIDCVFRNRYTDCAEAHQDIRIERTFAHANYFNGFGRRHDDIGLIRLAKRIKYNDFVKPICLPINVARSLPGEKLEVAGWGLTENQTFSAIKLKVILPVVDNQQCRKVFRPLGGNVSDAQLCAGGHNGRDSCFGDSGGPLMRTFPNRSEYFVEGIVSFSSGCGVAGIPSVNTRVASYLDWILDRMDSF